MMPKRRASITATSLSGGGRGARLIGPEANGFGVGELCYTEKLDHCVRRSARFTPPTATPGEAGTRECSCVLPDRSEVRFTIEGDPVCPNVLDACLNDRFDREGPRRCVFLDSGADELGCHIWRECSRDASFDGASITLREQLLVSCGSVDDGEWECDCPAGCGSLDIEHDDPAQACQIAEAACLTDDEMAE